MQQGKSFQAGSQTRGRAAVFRHIGTLGELGAPGGPCSSELSLVLDPNSRLRNRNPFFQRGDCWRALCVQAEQSRVHVPSQLPLTSTAHFRRLKDATDMPMPCTPPPHPICNLNRAQPSLLFSQQTDASPHPACIKLQQEMRDSKRKGGLFLKWKSSPLKKAAHFPDTLSAERQPALFFSSLFLERGQIKRRRLDSKVVV